MSQLLATNDVSPMKALQLPSARRGSFRANCFLALALALLCSAAGCGRVQQGVTTPQDGYTVTLSAQPSAPAVGDGMLLVTLRDPDGKPVTGARLQVEGNMSHAGMQPSFGKVVSEEAGQYTVAIAWTMGGDWSVDVRATLADGRVVTRRFPLTVRAR